MGDGAADGVGRECPTVYMPHFSAPVNIGFWKTPAPAPTLCRAAQTRPRISHQKSRGAAAKSRTPVFPIPLLCLRTPPISSPGRTAAHLRRDSSSPPPVPTRSSIQQAESPVKSRARGREMGAADADEVHLSRLRDRPPVFPPPPPAPLGSGVLICPPQRRTICQPSPPTRRIANCPPDTQSGHSAPSYPLQTRRNCLNAY